MSDYRRDENGKFKHGYSHRNPARVWPSVFTMNGEGGFVRLDEDDALRTFGYYGGPQKLWLSLVEDFVPLHVPADEQITILKDGQEFIARQDEEEIFRNRFPSVVLEYAFQKLRSPLSLDAAPRGSYGVRLTRLSDKELRIEYKRDLAHGGYHQDEIKAEMDSRGHVKRGGLRERLSRIRIGKRDRGGRGRRDR